MAGIPDLPRHAMMALPHPTLATLRRALLESGDPNAAVRLQEAGSAGGEACHAAFASWLTERGVSDPATLAFDEFAAAAGEFFATIGWGALSIGTLHGAAITIDAESWAEADDSPPDDAPACFVSSGLFADFFGRVGEAPLAVLEVECRSAGASRCRFLVASVEVLEAVYEALGRGEEYEGVLAAAG